MSEKSVIASAAEQGVRVYGISGYFLRNPLRTGILLGYSRMKETAIREGIQRVGKVL